MIQKEYETQNITVNNSLELSLIEQLNNSIFETDTLDYKKFNHNFFQKINLNDFTVLYQLKTITQNKIDSIDKQNLLTEDKIAITIMVTFTILTMISLFSIIISNGSIISFVCSFSFLLLLINSHNTVKKIMNYKIKKNIFYQLLNKQKNNLEALISLNNDKINEKNQLLFTENNLLSRLVSLQQHQKDLTSHYTSQFIRYFNTQCNLERREQQLRKNYIEKNIAHFVSELHFIDNLEEKIKSVYQDYIHSEDYIIDKKLNQFIDYQKTDFKKLL